MNNMRGYSIALYPETKKKLEIIKNEKEMTWDELFNYLMEVKESEKPKQEAQEERRMTKEAKELIGCFIAGGIMGVLFLWWMLAPLTQF